MWKQKLALALVLVMMFILIAPRVSFSMLPITEAMTQAKDGLKVSGKMSNDYLDHSVIDMTYVSSGSVVSHTYTGNNENLTINIFDVVPVSNEVAADKLTRFVFNLTNQYRPETEISIGFSFPDLETVNIYTYGALKHEAMLAIISGIPDCLKNPRLGDSDNNNNDGNNSSIDSSWPEEYYPDRIIFTSFKIGDNTYKISDGTTETIQTMDVTPEILGERTFMPVRYLAYALGITEDGVQWDGITNTVTIIGKYTTIELTIDSNIELINGESVEMDAAPYIKEIEGGGRTMLPARWVAEPFGATVKWNEATQQATIEITLEAEQDS